jgi:hypothetical protein
MFFSVVFLLSASHQSSSMIINHPQINIIESLIILHIFLVDGKALNLCDGDEVKIGRLLTKARQKKVEQRQTDN